MNVHIITYFQHVMKNSRGMPANKEWAALGKIQTLTGWLYIVREGNTSELARLELEKAIFLYEKRTT